MACISDHRLPGLDGDVAEPVANNTSLHCQETSHHQTDLRGVHHMIADLEMMTTPGQVSESRNPKTFKGLRVPIRATI